MDKISTKKDKGAIPVIILAFFGGLAALFLMKKKAPVGVCTPGEVKCVGVDLYLCNANGQWEVSETNSASCQVTPGATYYSPFGGKRFPICTKILIPNVNPFGDFLGGDLLWSGFSDFFFDPGVRSGLQYVNSEQQLYEATPAEWDAGSATSFVKSVTLGYVDDVLVMAVDYSCQEYWDSKERLAQMIAGRNLYFGTIPTEWILQYGVTCPTCGGTGKIIGRRGHQRDCPTCGGLGKILMIDLSRGIRDWAKSMDISTNPPVYAGIETYNYTIHCPYCSAVIEHDHEDGRIALARDLLDHIETNHPDHPLTAPAF
jgi:hypothetical protein